MPVTLFCPVCNVKVEVADRLAGKSTPCPSCGNVIDVPRQDRARAGFRLARRLKILLPWLFAGAALTGLATALVSVLELQSVRRSLEEDLRSLRAKLAELERSAPAPAKAAAAPEAPPAPKPAAPADDRAALQHEIAALHDTDEEMLRKLQDLETELARLRGIPAPPPPKAVEIANDEDVEIKIDAKQDLLAPRPRFTFSGPATNTGTKQAPVVLVTVRVTGFLGLDPVTRAEVTRVPYAASITERVRSLPPGTTAGILRELYPTDPALLSRQVAWEPQFEVATRVLRE